MPRSLAAAKLAFVLLPLVSFAGCPDDHRRHPLGELCDTDAACVSGLCVDSLCIDPGVCATRLADASVPPALAHACVSGIATLVVTTDANALTPGDSTAVHARATFVGPASSADTSQVYDLTRAADFAADPSVDTTLARVDDALVLTVAPSFVGTRVTLSATLGAGDAVRHASTEVTIRRAPGWGTPELVADVAGAATPVAVGVDTSGCAVLLWIEGSGARLASEHACLGGREAPTTLAAPIGGATVQRAALSVAPTGDAVAVWLVAGAPPNDPPAFEIWAARFAPQEGWVGLPEKLAAPAAGVLVESLAVAAAGPSAALVAWQEMTSDAFPVRARRLSQSGWAPSEDVDATGSVIGIPSQGLRVTLTATGDEAQVVWHDAAATYASRSRGAGWDPHVIVIDNLALGTPIAFGDAAQTVDGHVLVTDSGGFDNGVGVPEGRIDARLYAPDSGWGDELVVEHTTTAGPPRATFTAEGAAIAWLVASGAAAPRTQVALGRWTSATGWSRAVVLDEFAGPSQVRGMIPAASAAIAPSLLATWVVYRRTGDDQIVRLTAIRADGPDDAPLPILAPIEPAAGTVGAFVFATGPAGHGLAAAAVSDGARTTLWAVRLQP